jgi:hypothetical protein
MGEKVETKFRDESSAGSWRKNGASMRGCSNETGRPRLSAIAGWLLVGLLLAGHSDASPSSGISSVFVARGFFNPRLGQAIRISLAVERPGLLTLLVLDGDGRVARRLVSREPVEAGKLSRSWDGRDAEGEVVTDGVYTLKIELRNPGRRDTYLPSGRNARPVEVETTFYDRQNGVVAYKLAAPSRVFLQARSFRVSRTIVAGEPRAAGSVIDYWNGFDEDGKEYIAALPGFTISITAIALPENAIITVGNRISPALASARVRP